MPGAGAALYQGLSRLKLVKQCRERGLDYQDVNKDAASGLLGRGLAGEGAVAARPALRLRFGQRPRDAAALALPAFGLEVELLQGAIRHLARRNHWLSESMTLGRVAPRAL